MWVRILVVVAILAVGTGIYLWCFGEQTMWVLGSRYIGWKVPMVNKTPTDIQDRSIANGIGKKVSYFGYEFEVPWDDLDERATKASANRAVLTFRSGLRLMFYSGPPKEFVKTVLSSQADPDALRQFYGKDVLDSDYAFLHRMLYTTPSQVTVWTQRRDAVGTSMMLTIKAIATPLADTGMFSISTPEFKGFQYGNAQSKPKRVLVDLFADDASLEFTFLGREKQQLMNVSQADINRVVQTTRKVKSPPRHEDASDARLVSSHR